MASDHTQGIKVSHDDLEGFIRDIAKGKLRIPRFQRDFVWDRSKVIQLFDSIYHGYPIGTFFIWQAEKEHNHLFKSNVELGLPSVDKHDEISFIIDGQQRSTSLYAVINGLTLERADGSTVDYGRICFDLEEVRFATHNPGTNRYIAVRDIWDEPETLYDELDPQYRQIFRRCQKRLQKYPLSIVEVRDKELPDVCDIFQRINQSGQRLSRFDLITATTYSPNFDLRERLNTDLQQHLEDRQFGRISEEIVTQLMALHLTGRCTERNEYSLTADQIQANWKSCVESVILAADALRKGMGVQRFEFLPYNAHLILLAYFFLKSGKRSFDAKQAEWIQRWFWRSAFGVRYGTGGPSRIGQDRELFDDVINGGMPTYEIPVNLTLPSIERVRMTQTSSAIRNAFLCLLAIREPLRLDNNTKLDMLANISDLTSNEKHHIFPVAFLRRSGPTNADVHVLPNFCYLPADLNKRISDSAPVDYVAALQKENPRLSDAAERQLIPIAAGSGMLENDYSTFLNQRSAKILEEVERLCGYITAPRAGERQIEIERLEHRLRDVVHSTLSTLCGDDYWEVAIPSSIREAVELRLADAIKKAPTIREEDLRSPRRRLEYCDVMDYATIILKKANWPAFEDMFGKKPDLERHMIDMNNFRNCVMHSRDMEEYIRLKGEAALIWIQSATRDGDDAEDPEPEETLVEENATTSPSVTGQSNEGASVQWDAKLILSVIERTKGSQMRAIAEDLLSWMEKLWELEWTRGGKEGAAYIKGGYSDEDVYSFSLWSSGHLRIDFRTFPDEPKTHAVLKEAIERLNQIPGLNLKPIGQFKWRYAPLNLFSEMAMRDRLKETVEWLLPEMNKGNDKV